MPDAEGLLSGLDGMQGRNTVLMVLDTLVDDKTIVVGVTVGTIAGNSLEDVRVRPIGNAVISRLAAHHTLNYPDTSTVVIAGVNGVGNAIQRVRSVLRNAPPKSGVLLLPANDKIYDAVVNALNVDFQSAGANSH